MGFYFSLCRHRYREASHLPHGFQCQSLSSSPIKRCSSDSLTNKRIRRDVELRVVSTKTSNKNLCWVEEITPGLDISSPFLPHDTFKDIFLKWILLNHVRGTPRCHPTFQELRRFFWHTLMAFSVILRNVLTFSPWLTLLLDLIETVTEYRVQLRMINTWLLLYKIASMNPVCWLRRNRGITNSYHNAKIHQRHFCHFSLSMYILQ